ncbi:MAG: urate hydroxylase PuuD [Sphingomonas sp.]
MAKIFGNFRLALLIGIALLVAAMVGLHRGTMDATYWMQFSRFLHVFVGILWIGLLYYFNFVQIPTMPSVPAELKPGVTKYIAPVALFWFRYAALVTVLVGLILAELIAPGYLMDALMLKQPRTTIGVGMWLGIIMAANVWFIIWPNQKKALGMVQVEDEVKARAATTAMIGSRSNLILSLPMLYCMIAGAHIG